jgi:hypothetical protein
MRHAAERGSEAAESARAHHDLLRLSGVSGPDEGLGGWPLDEVGLQLDGGEPLRLESRCCSRPRRWCSSSARW